MFQVKQINNFLTVGLITRSLNKYIYIQTPGYIVISDWVLAVVLLHLKAMINYRILFKQQYSEWTLTYYICCSITSAS